MLPSLCAGGYLGQAANYAFAVGIVAAAFSSADSAYTALTTSVCVDVIRRPASQRLRRGVHAGVILLSFLLILLFRAFSSTSVINAVYQIASYTYGPLLGLFAFGLFTKKRPRPSLVPLICIAVPLLCRALAQLSVSLWNYHFGYELLILNGLLVFILLWLSSLPSGSHKSSNQV